MPARSERKPQNARLELTGPVKGPLPVPPFLYSSRSYIFDAYTPGLTEALTFASLSLDPLADVCWAILQSYAVRFTAVEKGDCILTYKS